MGSAVAPASMSTVRPGRVGSTTASPGRGTPGSGRSRSRAVATTPPVDPADTTAAASPRRTSWQATATLERGRRRLASAPSSMARLSSAGTMPSSLGPGSSPSWSAPAVAARPDRRAGSGCRARGERPARPPRSRRGRDRRPSRRPPAPVPAACGRAGKRRPPRLSSCSAGRPGPSPRHRGPRAALRAVRPGAQPDHPRGVRAGGLPPVTAGPGRPPPRETPRTRGRHGASSFDSFSEQCLSGGPIMAPARNSPGLSPEVACRYEPGAGRPGARKEPGAPAVTAAGVPFGLNPHRMRRIKKQPLAQFRDYGRIFSAKHGIPQPGRKAAENRNLRSARA